jgi:hypothetical protein
MPEEQEEQPASARWKFWLLLLFIFALGSFLIYIPDANALHLPTWIPVHEWLVELLHKLGDALVIAAVLAFAVDGYVKRALVAEVAKEVVDFAVGYTLPDEVKTHIRHILRLPCVRQDLVFRYEFSEVQATPPAHTDPYIEAICFASYKIVNLTDRTIAFEVRSSIQKSHLPGLPLNWLRRLHLPTMKIDLKDEELKRVSIVEGPYTKAIQNVKIRSGETNALQVKTERVSYHRFEDSIFLDLLEPPSLGLEVHVTAPAELEFEASFGGAGEVTTHHEGGYWTWRVPGAHLPGSHLHLAWHRDPAISTHAAQTSSAVVRTPTKPAQDPTDGRQVHEERQKPAVEAAGATDRSKPAGDSLTSGGHHSRPL